jgi:hypothetical protein
MDCGFSLLTLAAVGRLPAWELTRRKVMRALALLLPVLSLAFAPAPPPKVDPSKEDLEKLQGRWIGTGAYKGAVLEVYGEFCDFAKLPAVSPLEIRLDGPTYWNVTLDARKRPRWLDLERLGTRFLCVYDLEGDTLKLCHNRGAYGGKRAPSGARRPASLSGRDGVLMTFKRAKP